MNKIKDYLEVLRTMGKHNFVIILFFSFSLSVLMTNVVIDIVTRKFEKQDMAFILALLWQILYIRQWMQATIVTKFNKKLQSIIHHLLDAIFAIKAANSQGISISELESRGLFYQIQKELNEIISPDKKVEITEPPRITPRGSNKRVN